MNFTGIEIAWVELKSNKPVGLINSAYTVLVSDADTEL